jgi:APA family basic amino acid/polyamine antiporter
MAAEGRLGFRRVLGGGALASIAYGEIASSLYFAVGIVALYALGFTPWVLLIVGALFLLVALSYAEGTAAIPEPGGAATFVRRAFNDIAGFVTGWALFLDYLIVIALSALFVPHYAGNALGWGAPTHEPADVLIGVGVILAVGGARLFRRTAMYRFALGVAAIAFATHVLLILLGAVFLFSTGALSAGLDLGVAPTWSAIAFSLPLAMLAYTGLETVSNLAAETREPGTTLPRSLFLGIGAVVVVSVLVGIVGISAYPAHADPGPAGTYTTELGRTWLRAPLVGIAAALDGHVPGIVADAFRTGVGISGVLVLIAAVTTSMSGAGRLAFSMARYDMLPHAFATLSRRSLIPSASIVSATLLSVLLLLLSWIAGREVAFLASLYSFGILIAFTAAQVAVVRLRFTAPQLARPFWVPGNVRIRGTAVPVAALVGAPATLAILVAALATHAAPRLVGPVWLVLGLALFVAVRQRRTVTVMGRASAAVADLVPEVEGAYVQILVPVKLGLIGEEMLGTALRLAEEQGGRITALHVVRVPLDKPLEAELIDQEELAEASLADAKLLAAEHGVVVEGKTVRARAIGHAIVDAADELGADLILLGSAPRWRRQSRFFSPTVDYVLRRASCEVMVVAYPQGVLDDEEEASL